MTSTNADRFNDSGIKREKMNKNAGRQLMTVAKLPRPDMKKQNKKKIDKKAVDYSMKIII